MKMKKSYFVYLLCILPFLEMPRWGYVPEVNRLFLVAKMISAVYVISIVVINNSFNRLDIAFIAYCLIGILSTVINKGQVMDAISESLAILIPLFLMEFYMNRLTLAQLLKPFVYIQGIYMMITAVQLLRVPFHVFYVHGLRASYSSLDHDRYGYIYSLGEPKRFVFILLPMLMFALLLWSKQSFNSYLKICFFCCCSLFVVIYSWGASAILALFGAIVYWWINEKYIIIKKFIDIWKIWIGFLIMNVVLISTNFLFEMSWFASLFGKSSTLSGRTYIWAKALIYIKSSILYGNGINRPLMKERFWDLVHVHNLLLNILYQGGIIQLLIFNYICYLTVKKLYQFKEKRTATIIVGALLGFFILALTDTTDNNMLFLILVFGYSVDKETFNKSKVRKKE